MNLRNKKRLGRMQGWGVHTEPNTPTFARKNAEPNTPLSVLYVLLQDEATVRTPSGAYQTADLGAIRAMLTVGATSVDHLVSPPLLRHQYPPDKKVKLRIVAVSTREPDAMKAFVDALPGVVASNKYNWSTFLPRRQVRSAKPRTHSKA